MAHKQTILKLIEQAAKGGWMELDLSRNRLTSVPGEMLLSTKGNMRIVRARGRMILRICGETATGGTIREVARERTNLSDDELDRLLRPDSMTEPGNVVAGAGAGQPPVGAARPRSGRGTGGRRRRLVARSRPARTRPARPATRAHR